MPREVLEPAWVGEARHVAAALSDEDALYELSAAALPTPAATPRGSSTGRPTLLARQSAGLAGAVGGGCGQPSRGGRGESLPPRAVRPVFSEEPPAERPQPSKSAHRPEPRRMPGPLGSGGAGGAGAAKGGEAPTPVASHSAAGSGGSSSGSAGAGPGAGAPAGTLDGPAELEALAFEPGSVLVLVEVNTPLSRPRFRSSVPLRRYLGLQFGDLAAAAAAAASPSPSSPPTPSAAPSSKAAAAAAAASATGGHCGWGASTLAVAFVSSDGKYAATVRDNQVRGHSSRQHKPQMKNSQTRKINGELKWARTVF